VNIARLHDHQRAENTKPKGPSAPAPSESPSLDFELNQRLTCDRILSGRFFRSLRLICTGARSTILDGQARTKGRIADKVPLRQVRCSFGNRNSRFSSAQSVISVPSLFHRLPATRITRYSASAVGYSPSSALKIIPIQPLIEGPVP